MSNPPIATDQRRSEAERLIEVARRLLDRPSEDVVVNYLDHAIEALHMIDPELPSPGASKAPSVLTPRRE